MPSLVDEKFAALRTQGFTGAMPEMISQWLVTFGASKTTLADDWKEMLATQFTAQSIVDPPTGQRNDDWFTLLRDLGHTGAMNDMELQFWEAGGTFPP